MYSDYTDISDINSWFAENYISMQLSHLHTETLNGAKLKPFYTEKGSCDHLYLNKPTHYSNGHFSFNVHDTKANETYEYHSIKRLKDGKRLSPIQSHTPPPKRTTASDTDDTERKNAYKLKKANGIYSRAKPAIDFPYLIKKDVPQYGKEAAPADVAAINRMFIEEAHGTRWDMFALIDHTGETKGYQVINERGDKRPIGSTKGLFHLIEGTLTGRETTPKEIYVVEGLATGLSIHAADPSRFVAVCLSTSNLEHAVAEIKKRWPKIKLRFCVDNDWRPNPEKPTTAHNAGLKAATLAAAKYRKTSKLYLCPLVDGKKADFNDYAQVKGSQSVTDDMLKQCEVPIITPNDARNAQTFKDFLKKFEHCVKYLSDKGAFAEFSEHVQAMPASKEKIALINKVSPEIGALWVEAVEAYLSKIDKRLSALFKQSLPYHEHVSFNSNYLPETSIKFGTANCPEITLIKSPLGSGKTTQINKLIKLCKQLGYKVVLIVPRRSLARWAAKLEKDGGLGLADYQEVPIPRNHDYLAIVINSVPLIAGNQREVVIIDESEQVCRQIASQIIDNKKEAIQGLDSVLNGAISIIFADAHLSRITEFYASGSMQRLGKTPRYTRYDNHFKRFEGRLMVKYDDYAKLKKHMADCAIAGKKIFIATNGFEESYRIKNILSKFIDSSLIKLINSDDSQSEENLEFIKNIEQEILDYQVLIVSPSLTSGVDINDLTRHFDEVIGFFYSSDQNGIAADAMQQLNRVRYAKSCHVWYESKKYNLVTNKGQLIDQVNHQEHFIQFHTDTDGEINSQHRQAANLVSPYTPLYADVKAFENAMLVDGSGAFYWLASRDGWQVVDADALEDIEPMSEQEAADIKLRLKAAKDEFKAEEITGKLKSDPLTDKEFIEREKTGVKSRSERWANQAHGLKQFYCETSLTPELLEIDRNGKTQEIVKRWETLKATDSELIAIDKAALEKANDKWSHPHLKSKLLLKQLYKAVLAAFRGDPNNGVNSDSKSVKAFAGWFKQNEKALAAIGININTEPKKIMASLGIYVGKLGYKTESTRATTGKRERLFKLIKGDLLAADDSGDPNNCHIGQLLAKRKQYGRNHIDKQLKGLSSQLAVQGFTIDIIKIDHGQLDLGRIEGQTGCELQATQQLQTDTNDLVDIYALPEELERALAANFF